MTTAAPTADAVLISRCRAILIERAKNAQPPIDCLNISKLLGQDSSACYRALCAIEGVIIEGTARPLTKFSVGRSD